MPPIEELDMPPQPTTTFIQNSGHAPYSTALLQAGPSPNSTTQAPGLLPPQGPYPGPLSRDNSNSSSHSLAMGHQAAWLPPPSSAAGSDAAAPFPPPLQPIRTNPSHGAAAAMAATGEVSAAAGSSPLLGESCLPVLAAAQDKEMVLVGWGALPPKEHLVSLLAAAPEAQAAAQQHREVAVFTSRGPQAIAMQRARQLLASLGLPSAATQGSQQQLGSKAGGVVGAQADAGQQAPPEQQLMMQGHGMAPDEAAVLADIAEWVQRACKSATAAFDLGRALVALRLGRRMGLDEVTLVVAATASSCAEATTAVQAIIHEVKHLYD